MPGESNVVEAGTQELALRNQLGDAGYNEWKRRNDAIEEATVADKRAHVGHTAATARLVAAKVGFVQFLSLALFAATCCGVAEFIRWVA